MAITPIVAVHSAFGTSDPVCRGPPKSLSELQQSLAATERERPRLREFISEKTRELEALTEEQSEKE